MNDDLNRLEEKLARFRREESSADRKQAAENAADARDAENMSRGIRAGAELVTCIAAGAFLGWLLDGWLETKPLFLIIFLLAGIGAGFMNVYRITQNIGSSVGFAPLHNRQKQGKTAPVIDDDPKD